MVSRIEALEQEFSKATVETVQEVVDVKKSNIEIGKQINEFKEETEIKFKKVDEIKNQVDHMQRKIEVLDIGNTSGNGSASAVSRSQRPTI